MISYYKYYIWQLKVFRYEYLRYKEKDKLIDTRLIFAEELNGYMYREFVQNYNPRFYSKLDIEFGEQRVKKSTQLYFLDEVYYFTTVMKLMSLRKTSVL